jgi:hypothetical protein
MNARVAIRSKRLIEQFINKLDLDLNGITVATETGTGPYLFSALIACLSGAKQVFTVAPSSLYATHENLKNELLSMAKEWGVSSDQLVVLASREELPNQIDIFLNLGFLRPMDQRLLSKGSSKAVLSYMCEAWEFRPGDLDMDYCEAKAIPVAGVHENFEDFGVFASCGHLAMKLLFEAGVEISGCTIGTLSSDPFGTAIFNVLDHCDAHPIMLSSSAELQEAMISKMDALVVASYSDSINLLNDCPLSAKEIAQCNPDLKIIQFAGCIDCEELVSAGLTVYPPNHIQPFRMAKTLSHLGVRPVLALHSLGIKVGELLYRQKAHGAAIPDRFKSLVQPMNKHIA